MYYYFSGGVALLKGSRITTATCWFGAAVELELVELLLDGTELVNPFGRLGGMFQFEVTQPVQGVVLLFLFGSCKAMEKLSEVLRNFLI